MSISLTDADFEAYAPAKQRSNVYNRERLEVKQRLLPLGKLLEAAVTGSDGAPLELAASPEHPALFNHKQVEAQHLYFSRSEAARRQLDTIIDRARGVASLLDDPTPQRSHIFLTVSVCHDRLEVALRLHPEATVDRQNLLRKCQDTFEVDRLVALLRALPASFQVGLAPTLADAPSIDREAVGALLGRFAVQAAGPTFAGPTTGDRAALLSVLRTHLRADVIAAGEGIAQLLVDELRALLPLYRYAAWARDNDFVSVREALAKKETERRQKGIVQGDAIRVVRGLFSGQVGTVQDVDPRGALRILVGKRTVKLDAADVERS